LCGCQGFLGSISILNPKLEKKLKENKLPQAASLAATGFGASAGTDWLEDGFLESSQNSAQNLPMENYFGTIPEGVDVLAPKNHLEDSRVTDAAPKGFGSFGRKGTRGRHEVADRKTNQKKSSL
jgi:hypothetical protein